MAVAFEWWNNELMMSKMMKRLIKAVVAVKVVAVVVVSIPGRRLDKAKVVKDEEVAHDHFEIQAQATFEEVFAKRAWIKKQGC